MKLLLTLSLLSVILTFYDPGNIVGCPMPEPTVVKNADGTYTRSQTVSVTLVACYSPPQTWQEEWTDYPEKGGKLIRLLSPKIVEVVK
jgi:hypothetical protein